MGLNFCPSCGSKLVADIKFCPSCGYEVTEKDLDKAKATKPQIPVESTSSTQVKKGPHVYAGFWERFFALIIDSIIMGIVSWAITTPLGLGATWPFNLQTMMLNQAVSWLLYFLYYFLLEAFNEGQTLGKMALSIRTVNENSFEPTNTSNYIINNLSRGAFLILDFIIGFLVNYGDENRRLRLLQNASRTVVIKTQ